MIRNSFFINIMKSLFAVSFVFLFTSFTSNKVEYYDLSVTAYNLKNDDGTLQFALYNQDGTIPDEDYTKYFKKQTVKIHKNMATTVFKNLVKGTYAVNILHDANSNGKIDKGIILPIEGVGFSNFQKINLANRPNFQKASFILDENKSVVIKTIYF